MWACTHTPMCIHVRKNSHISICVQINSCIYSYLNACNQNTGESKLLECAFSSSFRGSVADKNELPAFEPSKYYIMCEVNIVYIHICMYKFVLYIYIFMYVCTCMYMYVHVCVWNACPKFDIFTSVWRADVSVSMNASVSVFLCNVSVSVSVSVEYILYVWKHICTDLYF